MMFPTLYNITLSSLADASNLTKQDESDIMHNRSFLLTLKTPPQHLDSSKGL